MTDIEIIRELHCYKKMYNHLQQTITQCIKTSRDLDVREKLMKVQQEAEDIYTGEEYIGKALTADELVIILLLSFIREREISKGIGLMDSDTINEAIDWTIALQGIDFQITDEMLEKNIKNMLNTSKKQDSEQ